MMRRPKRSKNEAVAPKEEVYLKADYDRLFLYLARFILKKESLLDVT
jgi:hypothetical protein